jgi:hypothetical protein
MLTTSTEARRACRCVAAAAVFLLVALPGGASTASAQPLPSQCELRPPPYGPNPVACARELLAGLVPAECQLRPPPYPQPDPVDCLAALLEPVP